MARGTALFTLFILLFLLSCSENDTDSYIEPVPELEFNYSQLYKGYDSLQSPDENMDFTFSGISGKSYTLYVYQETDLYYTLPEIILTYPDGSTRGESSFTCLETGSYRFTISIPSYYDSWPYKFSYKITEIPSLDGIIDGKWLLNKKTVTSLGRSKTYLNSVDNASQMIEFRNDSCFYFSYDIFGNALHKSGGIFANSGYAYFNYQLNNEKLVLSQKNSYGAVTESYTRFAGEIDDITWEGENIGVNDDLLGTWYCSSRNFGTRESMFQGRDYSDSATYNSIDQSIHIISFTKDTIVRYQREFGNVNSMSENISANYFGNLREFEKSDEGILFKSLHFWMDDEHYNTRYNQMEYKRYTGKLPPESWQKVGAPLSTAKLIPGTPYTTAANAGDTIWCEINLEEEKEYTLKRHNEDIGEYFSSYFINSETMIPEYYIDSYRTKSSGKYYLALLIYPFTPENIQTTFSVEELL